MIDPGFTIWDLFLWSLPGTAVRILFGIYKVFMDQGYLKIDWTRLVVEVCASPVFGTFTVFILLSQRVYDVTAWFGWQAPAIAGGFFGADLISRLEALFKAKLTISSILPLRAIGINPRQEKAIQQARAARMITNDDYQRLNGVSDATASRELAVIVKKGLLKKEGAGRGVRYIP